jgi:hypothetical protein
MPIREYSPQVGPSGQLTSRADAGDFGAGIGAAMKDVARSEFEQADAQQTRGRAMTQFGLNMASVANAIYKTEEQDDITSVHTTMAEARARGYERVKQMANETQPGDQTFVQRVGDSFAEEFKNLSSNVKTQAGQKLFASEASNMRSQFMAEAVGIQSSLDGKFATNQYDTLKNSYGTIVSQDNTRLDESLEKINQAIDDKGSIFSRVDQSVRDKLKAQAAEDMTVFAARGFVRRHPGVATESLPENLRNSLRNQTVNPPTPGLPPNLGAETVKPYNQSQMTYISNKIDAPSIYDDRFKAAANRYGLDWRELKMRSVAESGLNPSAESSQGAGGIMQFTEEKAAELGINRNDPTDSIFGAARLLAKYKAAAGGDMAKVDMMYYGGESGKGWGPNTKQYAANLAAVRQISGLGGTQTPESFANTGPGTAGGDEAWKKVKTGIEVLDRLPPDKLFSVLQEADHYETAFRAEQDRARVQQNREKSEMQDARANGVMERIVNPNDKNGGVISESQIMEIPDLSWEKRHSLIQFKSAYEKEQSREIKSHPAAFNAFIDRIYAPENDPNKIYGTEDIIKAFNNREISYPEFRQLQNEITELKSGSTNGFRKDYNSALETVNMMFSRSIQGQIDPASSASAAYQFRQYAEREISKARQDKRDPYELLNPKSPDFLMSPDKLRQFMPNMQQTSQNAATMKVQQVAQNESRAAEGGKKIGNSYPFSDGKSRIYLGGPLNSPTSWQDIDPTSDK